MSGYGFVLGLDPFDQFVEGHAHSSFIEFTRLCDPAILSIDHLVERLFHNVPALMRLTDIVRVARKPQADLCIEHSWMAARVVQLDSGLPVDRDELPVCCALIVVIGNLLPPTAIKSATFVEFAVI